VIDGECGGTLSEDDHCDGPNGADLGEDEREAEDDYEATGPADIEGSGNADRKGVRMGTVRDEEDEGASEDDHRVQDESGSEAGPLRQPGVRGGLERRRDPRDDSEHGEQSLHRHDVSTEAA